MKALDIEYDRLDYADTKTRLAILELLSRAQILTGFDGFSGKLFIEVYPDDTGGCVFYFTVLGGERESGKPTGGFKETPMPTFPDPITFLFDNADNLSDAAHGLYRRCGHRIYNSSLYRMEGKYYLVVRPFDQEDAAITSILSEYATLFCKGGLGAAFLAEHGSALALDSAIDRLAGY